MSLEQILWLVIFVLSVLGLLATIITFIWNYMD